MNVREAIKIIINKKRNNSRLHSVMVQTIRDGNAELDGGYEIYHLGNCNFCNKIHEDDGDWADPKRYSKIELIEYATKIMDLK